LENEKPVVSVSLFDEEVQGLLEETRDERSPDIESPVHFLERSTSPLIEISLTQTSTPEPTVPDLMIVPELPSLEDNSTPVFEEIYPQQQLNYRGDPPASLTGHNEPNSFPDDDSGSKKKRRVRGESANSFKDRSPLIQTIDTHTTFDPWEGIANDFGEFWFYTTHFFQFFCGMGRDNICGYIGE
jgi:hypothetical protein